MGGVAHGTSSSTRLIVCRRYLRTVLLVSRNASASPSTMRTVTPTTVSQITVLNRTLRKSRLVSSSQ